MFGNLESTPATFSFSLQCVVAVGFPRLAVFPITARSIPLFNRPAYKS